MPHSPPLARTGISKRESIPSVEPADLYQVPFYTRYIEMMEYKSLGAVSLPNFKHMGEDETKKKNKKVTECMFTTCRLYVPYLMPLEKKIENDVSTFLRKAVKGLRESRTLYHLQ